MQPSNPEPVDNVTSSQPPPLAPVQKNVVQPVAVKNQVLQPAVKPAAVATVQQVCNMKPKVIVQPANQIVLSTLEYF